MKQKFLHVLIMVLAVAAVVGGLALFSDWVAPQEAAAPLATAVAASPAQGVPEGNEAVADHAASVEETVVVPADDGAVTAPAGEEAAADNIVPADDATITVQFIPEDDPQTEQPVLGVVDGVPVVQLADLMGGEEVTENTIIGRWQMIPECVAELYGIGDVVCVVELTEDGKYTNTITVMGYSDTYDGTYTVDGNAIVVDGTAAEYVLDGDLLTIKADGTEQTYARMK